MNDPVNHPAHYTNSDAVCSECGTQIECIDVTQHMTFCLGNAVKYIWRAGLKDEDTTIQDLAKAVWYIQREIQRLEEEQPDEPEGFVYDVVNLQELREQFLKMFDKEGVCDGR